MSEEELAAEEKACLGKLQEAIDEYMATSPEWFGPNSDREPSCNMLLASWMLVFRHTGWDEFGDQFSGVGRVLMNGALATTEIIGLASIVRSAELAKWSDAND